jgi:hypothetical protein
LAAALAAALLGASSAQAVVTVGSPLVGPFSPATIGAVPATIANGALPETGANVTSPVNGTIVTWRIASAVGGPFRLRVLRPGEASGTYTGVGTGAAQAPTSTATHTFATSLPIQIGDLIGLDDSAASDQIGTATVTGSRYFAFIAPFPDGATKAPDGANQANRESAFNADVQPTNAFVFGKAKLKKSNGSAKLTVNVPNAGTLVLSGKGLKKATANAAAVGNVTLSVKAKGKAKKKLRKTGKAKVKPQVTFTPTGGNPATQAKKLALRQKL